MGLLNLLATCLQLAPCHDPTAYTARPLQTTCVPGVDFCLIFAALVVTIFALAGHHLAKHHDNVAKGCCGWKLH